MSTAAPPIPASAHLSTESFSIAGMHCASCVGRVEGAALKVPGVAEVAVNLAAESGRVTYDPSRTSAEAIAKAVTDFGYPTSVVVDRAAQEAEHRLLKAQEAANLSRKVMVSGALSLLIFALSHSELIGLKLLDPTTSGWVQFLLTLPIQLWAGAEFYVGSWHALRNRTTDMNVLIMLGTTAAFVFSTIALLAPHLVSFPGQHGHHVYYFESAAVIITLILTGRLLELRAKTQTNAAIRALMQLQAPTADRVNADGSVTTIALELVDVGDRLRVVPGAQVPVDGKIIEGTSALDESLLTGESMPQERGPGDPVIGGSLNTTGSLLIEATQVGEGTLLAKIIRLVEEAQGSKAPIQRLADQIAAIFVPIVLVIAALTAIAWLLFGAQLVPANQVTATALATTMAVLIIACPCALGLATPTAIMVGTGVGARRGVLIRNGAALEQLQRVTAVVLDKTGTLTQGKPVMVSLAFVRDAEEAIHGSAMAAIEARSEHPLARALVDGLAERGITPLTSTIDSWDSIPGGGVRASITGHSYLIGNQMLLEREGIDVTALRSSVETVARSGATPVLIAVDGAAIAVAGFADPLKADAPALIHALQQRGIRAILATGDHPAVAKTIAARASITEVHAALLPAAKQALIAQLQQEDEVVAMLGDGVNDAPALAQADIGVAMGTGTAVALESASVTLLRGQLGSFIEALDLSAATLRTIRQNLFWAFAYNVIGIPLAAGLYHVLFGWPFLNPMFAAAAMALSSVTVLSNSLRLRGWNPRVK